jgi:hypothetical protein
MAFSLYILKWRFNINNLVLKVRLYIQVNILTSVADELIALNASPFNFYISFTEITKFWILCSFNVEKILSEKLDDLKGGEGRYSKDLTLCREKVEEFQISEAKCESLCDESMTTIKKREKQLIDEFFRENFFYGFKVVFVVFR